MSDVYTIEARSLNLLGFASHDFWVLRDSAGNAIAELHGLATNPETGEPIPIGILGDELRFYEFKRANGDPTFIAEGQEYSKIFFGSEEKALALWNRAVELIPYMNSRHVSYSPLGVLSYRTYAKYMW